MMMLPPLKGSISGPDDGAVVALAIVNTILGASTGGLAVLFINKFLFAQPWSFLMTLNGALAGMVALCAGCDKYEPWAALLIGACGGIGFITIHHLMIRLRLDDPLGKSPFNPFTLHDVHLLIHNGVKSRIIKVTELSKNF